MGRSKAYPKPTCDISVRRQEIANLFDPPLPDSTFYDYVKQLKIVPTVDARGFYLLNATRLRLGMPEVDVSERANKQKKSRELKEPDYTRMTMALLYDNFYNIFGLFDFPNVLTEEQTLKLKRSYEAHLQNFEPLKTELEKINYVAGALKARNLIELEKSGKLADLLGPVEPSCD